MEGYAMEYTSPCHPYADDESNVELSRTDNEHSYNKANGNEGEASVYKSGTQTYYVRSPRLSGKQ
jgi:hypothetical protein